MAKKKVEETTTTSIDTLNDNLVSLGEKIQRNKKRLAIIGTVFGVIVVAILCFVAFVHRPSVHTSDVEKGLGDVANLNAPKDSASIATAKSHYEAAINEGHNSGNNARLELAKILYEEGNYDEAIEQLNEFKTNDKIIASAALSLKGDCYANKGEFDEAVKCFEEAIDKSDENPYLTPFYMEKLSHIYHAQGKYGEEAEVIEEIFSKYPQYVNAEPKDMDNYQAVQQANAKKAELTKNLERAKALK